jgi:predicted amidophosphoribosyltransferase
MKCHNCGEKIPFWLSGLAINGFTICKDCYQNHYDKIYSETTSNDNDQFKNNPESTRKNNYSMLSFCPKCGAEIKKNSNFCGECGKPIEGTNTNHTDTPKKQENSPMIKVIGLILFLLGLYGIIFGW